MALLTGLLTHRDAEAFVTTAVALHGDNCINEGLVDPHSDGVKQRWGRGDGFVFAT